MEADTLEQIEQDLQYLLKKGVTNNSTDLWSSRANKSLQKFVNSSGNLDKLAIKDFRRNLTFIAELPNFSSLLPINWLAGSRRGQLSYLKERLQVMQAEGDIDLLAKYPISEVGNPHIFNKDGFNFNRRWSNNIRYLNLARKFLMDPIKQGSRLLDIGGGYGILSSLLYRDLKGKSGLVEFPEQLLLAYYFLRQSLPDAKINTLKEAYEVEVINEDFISKFDIVLIPIECFHKIKGGIFKIFANFFSLGEMSDEWFDKYICSDVFNQSEYFYTINRFESKPTYQTDINILKYRLHEFENLHFKISPYERDFVSGKLKIFSSRVPYTSQFFEFIGKRK